MKTENILKFLERKLGKDHVSFTKSDEGDYVTIGPLRIDSYVIMMEKVIALRSNGIDMTQRYEMDHAPLGLAQAIYEMLPPEKGWVSHGVFQGVAADYGKRHQISLSPDGLTQGNIYKIAKAISDSGLLNPAPPAIEVQETVPGRPLSQLPRYQRYLKRRGLERHHS